MEQTNREAADQLFLKTRDYLLTGEEFGLVSRGPHGLLQTWPMPPDTTAYYKSDRYLSHTDRNVTFFERLYQTLKKVNLRSKARLLQKLGNMPGKLLDFGAGTGDFLSVAREAGWLVSGVEPNEEARLRARQKGVEVWPGLGELPDGQFDAITLWHVLEHVPDPEKVIAELRHRLKPSGHIIVAVPNYRSFDARFYGAHWAAYDTPRHLWHFSRPSLRALFHEGGFDLQAERPQWLDAYYVSWLSESYRKNFFAPVRAFWVACYSNLAAMHTGESSSRIFIFRKRAE